jgi:hypothetical protein
MRRAEFAEFREDFVRCGRRTGDNGLGSASLKQDGVAIAGVAFADKPFCLGQRVIESGSSVVGPGGHAERPIQDQDMVGASCGRDSLGRTWANLLPEGFGPVGGSDHGEEWEQQSEPP